MTNDATGELPQPPRSFAQPTSEADLRGNDYASAPDDDEYVRATAYRAHILAMSAYKQRVILGALKAPKEPLRALEHKLMPLANSAPPYLDSP